MTRAPKNGDLTASPRADAGATSLAARVLIEHKSGWQSCATRTRPPACTYAVSRSRAANRGASPGVVGRAGDAASWAAALREHGGQG